MGKGQGAQGTPDNESDQDKLERQKREADAAMAEREQESKEKEAKEKDKAAADANDGQNQEGLSEDEQARRESAVAQGLDPDKSTPEQRPQATTEPPDQTGEIQKRLREAGDVRADNQEPMGQEAYDRANSDEQKAKAAEQERTPTLMTHTRCVIDNPGQPDDGRKVAVIRVEEWDSLEDERIFAAGTPNSRFAKAKKYECRSRDGRHEYLSVSAEHLREVGVAGFERGET